jgi:hypothetical protein
MLTAQSPVAAGTGLYGVRLVATSAGTIVLSAPQLTVAAGTVALHVLAAMVILFKDIQGPG